MLLFCVLKRKTCEPVEFTMIAYIEYFISFDELKLDVTFYNAVD